MILTSPALKAEFQKLRGRRLQARCRIDYSDANIDNSVTAVSNGTAARSKLDQVYNGKQSVPYRWASLDGSWQLGTDALTPETEEQYALNEVGWWSAEPSLADQTFTTAPTLTVQFVVRKISEILLAFDDAREEFAEDFTVKLYDAADVLIYTHTVTANTGFRYNATIATQSGICSMELTITKWSHPFRQAKVAEMFTSISELYTGSMIMSLNVVENREFPENGIPLGSTASGMCVVRLFNKERRFDFDNTQSNLYGLVREGVRIQPEIGDGTDWVPLGVFYAKTWDVDKSELHATVTGIDRMAVMDESEYKVNQIITAPAPTTATIDTDAEWNAGFKDNVSVSSNKIRMVIL